MYKGCRERETKALQGQARRPYCRPGQRQPQCPRPRLQGAVRCGGKRPPAGIKQNMGTQPAAPAGNGL